MSTDTPADLQSRLVSDRYELRGRIGIGGMATVYRAFDRSLGREVAVKVLRDDLNANDEARERFAEEARASARIVHPNVVLLFDTGEDDAGRAYLVMECLSGRTLRDEMDRGALDPHRVMSVAVQMLEAIAAAHDVGVLHRDIKPANLLIADDQSLKVADFGIAKTAGALDVTDDGSVLGTPSYMAPERLQGEPATARSDLYSAAVVLHEAISGRRLFEADTPGSLVHAITSQDAPTLTELGIDVDPGLRLAVASALQRDPDLRPGAAVEMLQTIRGSAPTQSIQVAGVDSDGTVPLAVSREPTDVLPVASAPAVVEDHDQPAIVEDRDGHRLGLNVWRLVVASLVLIVVAVVLVSAASDQEPLAERIDPVESPLSPEAVDAFEELEEAVTP